MASISSSPPIIDEDDLCHDLLQDGLVCWGGKDNPRGMAASAPWDARSWEPKVWFLRKYWFLVGGWNDEMWSSARWWHAMRGEKLDPTSSKS